MARPPGDHLQAEPKKLVLVIEDDRDAQEMYGRLLWYNNYEVVFANTGTEGLRLAADAAPDLVLLDLRLPDLDGTVVLERLRRRQETAGIPVIVLTALPRVDYAEWATRVGCAALLQKPLEPLEVLLTVQNVIGPPAVTEAVTDTAPPAEPPRAPPSYPEPA